MYKVHLFQYKSQFNTVFNVTPGNQCSPISFPKMYIFTFIYILVLIVNVNFYFRDIMFHPADHQVPPVEQHRYRGQQEL
jgi:hypothetical protein